MKRNKLIYFCLLHLLSNTEIIAQSSVLANGNWYKISISQEGIYCISRADLIALGINPTSFDPRNISLYGNRAGMLSTKNNVPHADDLKEVAIKVKGESDGVFDVDDSIFFYGQSQIERIPDNSGKKFMHRPNIYSDSTYYFLTIKSVPGKRIANLASQPSFTNSTSTYTEYECHEMDSINFLHSGKAWYGDRFNSQSPKVINFDISHISSADSAFIYGELAGRTLISNAAINISSNGKNSNSNLPTTGGTPIDNYANPVNFNLQIPPPVSSGALQCDLQTSDPSALCWINFIEINFTRNLFLFKSQQVFSDLKSAAPGNVTRYMIDNANSSLQIWDVTDPLNIFNQQFNSTIPTVEYNANNDSPRAYVAFDGQTYLTPRLIGQIPNQNLHSLSQAKLIIVTAKQFLPEAISLANFHFTHDGLQSIAVTTEQIYNEYSTGSQDPVAIRDFVRQIFQRSAANNDSLKYLLLFGGASYDFKNHLGNISSFVPTYQMDGSLTQLQSHNTDDFFGYLDSTASDIGVRGDIGIGRIPVKNSSEATVINKIFNYNNSNTLGWWRKTISVVADDNDQNVHLIQMDTIANRIENNSCDFDLQKIYFDAYVKDFSGPNPTYPEVKRDLEKNITEGRLVIDYTGYSGTKTWGSENVLDYRFLQSINNSNLPLFITAAADYNRFDDPADTSGGQIISLSNLGAGIACIGSSRMAYSSSNFNFNRQLLAHLFEKENNQFLRLGDIFKRVKQGTFMDPYLSSVCLLGDPALKLNFPENDVVTTAINGQPTSTVTDTLVPGQSVRIDGEVHDVNGNVLSSFNGTISILVFNPKTLHYTLANDPGQSIVGPFYAWDDTLFYDSVPVINGVFTSTFNLPNNIDSGYGFGKISYYAQNNITDASGCYQNFVFKNLNAKVDEIPGVIVTVYPNPSNGKTEINITGLKVDNFNFSLYSREGKQVQNIEMNNNKFIIEKKSLAAGTYFYKIENQNHILVKKGKIIFD